MVQINGTLVVSSGVVVSPIVGNTNLGGAVYDPSTGKALWGVLVGTAFEVHRTTGDYKTLVTTSGSVTYLSTISSGPWINPSTVALQRIGGTLYAVVSGRRQSAANGAGQWVYRDTSANQDGSGPWTLHGTVHSIPTWGDGSTQDHHNNNGNVGGEILVMPSGRWLVNTAIFLSPDSIFKTYSRARQGVASSDDAGATWTVRLSVGWYLGGGSYGDRWSRNFGKFGSEWYVGGSGNVDPGKHFKSADGVAWTDIGPLGTTNEISMGFSWPAYTSSKIYRWSGEHNATNTGQSATAAPETMPAWVHEFSIAPMDFGGSIKLKAYPLIAQFGPSHYAVCGWGQVLGLDQKGAGWAVGRIGA